MSNDDGKNGARVKYDLAERTAKFGEMVIDYLKGLPRGPITNPLISQLVRSATSIGANYAEADEAVSRKDFRHRISICRKESGESKYWLRMLARAAPEQATSARTLWKEAKELHLIFCAIVRSCKQNESIQGEKSS